MKIDYIVFRNSAEKLVDRSRQEADTKIKSYVSAKLLQCR